MSFVRQWALTDKDKLYWEWKVVDGEMIAVVAKHEPNTFIPDLKKEKDLLKRNGYKKRLRH